MNKKLNIKQVEKISKALGDPYRLKLIEMINKQQDWLQCCIIVDMFDLAQSTVSHHLKQLTDAELLISEKDGRNAKYKVNKEMIAAYRDYLGRLEL